MSSIHSGIWIISVVVALYDVGTTANISLIIIYAFGLMPLTYLIVLVILKLLVLTKLYHSRFLNFHKTRNLIESFVGYQNRDNGGTEAKRLDSGLAHQLLHPAQYRPVSYGTITS